MGESVVLVDNDEIVAETLAEPLRTRGWEVEVCAPDEPDAFERIVAAAPAAVVLSLDDVPTAESHTIAHAAVSDSRLRHPIVLFLGGSPEQRDSAREVVPTALFVSADELLWVLKRVAPARY